MSYVVNEAGRCPHCQRQVVFRAPHNVPPAVQPSVKGVPPHHRLEISVCPGCEQLVLTFTRPSSSPLLLWPFGAGRKAPAEVPPAIAKDFDEASAILTISPNASAVLSRRCLQHTLKTAGANKRELADQIDEMAPQLPSHLADPLHLLRTEGNVAAHPHHDATDGEVLDVEPEAAELCLDVLEMLFDHVFVKPATTGAWKDRVNARQQAAGKKPLK